MIPKEQIKSQLNEIGYKTDASKSSVVFHDMLIEDISSILEDNEKIIHAIYGVCKNTIGILISTDKRLFFVGQMPIQKKSLNEQFHYDKLSAIDYSKGWLPIALLKFYEGGERIEVSGCNPDLAKKFANDVNQIIRNFKIQPTSTIINQPLDVAGQLEKFVKLRDQGVITEQEFQAQKMKLLNF